MRFQPGQSGNPSGRPKASKVMAKLIREATKDGAELVEYALSVFRDPKVSEANRLWAHGWLSDRGFGKAPLVLDVSFNDQDDIETRVSTEFEDLSDDALAALATLDRVRGAPGPTEH